VGIRNRIGLAAVCRPGAPSRAAVRDAAGVVQIKLRLLRISPMVSGCPHTPSTCNQRERHGVIEVAMG